MVAGAVMVPRVPDVGVLCPLRGLSGVPCPFCGMTTGVLETAQGDFVDAIAANPLAPVLVVAVVAAWLSLVLVRVRPRRPGVGSWSWSPPPPLTCAVLLFVWGWELHRFGFVG